MLSANLRTFFGHTRNATIHFTPNSVQSGFFYYYFLSRVCFDLILQNNKKQKSLRNNSFAKKHIKRAQEKAPVG